MIHTVKFFEGHRGGRDQEERKSRTRGGVRQENRREVKKSAGGPEGPALIPLARGPQEDQLAVGVLQAVLAQQGGQRGAGLGVGPDPDPVQELRQGGGLAAGALLLKVGGEDG